MGAKNANKNFLTHINCRICILLSTQTCKQNFSQIGEGRGGFIFSHPQYPTILQFNATPKTEFHFHTVSTIESRYSHPNQARHPAKKYIIPEKTRHHENKSTLITKFLLFPRICHFGHPHVAQVHWPPLNYPWHLRDAHALVYSRKCSRLLAHANKLSVARPERGDL